VKGLAWLCFSELSHGLAFFKNNENQDIIIAIGWQWHAKGLKTLREVLYYLSVVALSLYKSIGLLWVVSIIAV
jgi:hypothetical protein